LKDRTDDWSKRHKLSDYFKKMHFNFNDQQPHLFKEQILKKENIQKFIDDDLDLLMYLSKKYPNISFYWVGPRSWNVKLPKNIARIDDLNDFIKNHV
jgi:hypothetical protein